MSIQNIYNILLSEIKNPIGVCALMGNMKAESALKSNNMQNSYEAKLGLNDASYTLLVDSGDYLEFATDHVGYGLCQWTSSGRKAALYNYARKMGTSIGDETMQCHFCIEEMKTSYKNVWNKLVNAITVGEASDYVLKYYERPADQSGTVCAYRAKLGNNIYLEIVGLLEEQQEKGGTIKMRAIKRGEKGQLVRVWQSIVGDLDVDGSFGPLTENRTKEYQTEHGLVADGHVGPLTWSAGLKTMQTL